MCDEIVKQFLWSRACDLPRRTAGHALYKHDPLLLLLEGLIEQQRAWGPTIGTTKRVEPEAKLSRWINAQNQKKVAICRLPQFSQDFQVRLDLADFPENTQGTRIVTTSTNTSYLIDDTADFVQVIRQAFGNEAAIRAANIIDSAIPTFLYVTNSVESGGRAFSGDPFTGQLAAYSRIFAHDLAGQRVLNFVAYYPHQLYSQFFTSTGDILNNKGVRVLRSQATLIVTCGGVMLEPSEWKLLDADPTI